jgi:catechol 2,3-dioxygenase
MSDLPMPIPSHNFAPPFNIVRASHVVLTVEDLANSRAFYEGAIGLHVEELARDTLYLRGVEERQHHSLVSKQARSPAARHIGFKVASNDDLDKAAAFFKAKGLRHDFVDVPFQGRTLNATDPLGMPIEFYYHMEQREILLQKYGYHRGCHPQRLDHFNVFTPELQTALEFYVELGFRLTEYAEEDGPNGRIAAAWLHRKGNVHDLALTNGNGPRLHHIAYWTPTAMHIIHLCDVLATTGYLRNMERGPGRHGISNAFFLYARDPDGHRIEFYTSDYQTMDPDHAPIRWSLTDPRRQTLWGHPAPASWFEEGTPFHGAALREAMFQLKAIVAN